MKSYRVNVPTHIEGSLRLIGEIVDLNPKDPATAVLVEMGSITEINP